MSNCSKYEELISCMIDGELTQAEEKELMDHLAQCPSCRKMYEIYKEAFGSFDDITTEPPAKLKESAMTAVRGLDSFYVPAGAQAETAPAKKRVSRFWVKYAAIAACFAVVLLSVKTIADRGAFDDAKAESVADMDYTSESILTDTTFENTADTEAPTADTESPMDEPSNDADTGTAGDSSVSDGSENGFPEQPELDAPSESESGDDTAYEANICTIYISGALPDALTGTDMTDNGDGTYTIYISPDTASALSGEIREYSVSPEEPVSEYIVIYTP